MTDVKTDVVGSDYVHTFIATRSLRSQMQTTVTNIMVLSSAATESSSGTFQMLDQDGDLVFEHPLEKQVCKPGAKRSFIRSPNQNDMAFGYLC